jgi:HEAT repeat protein
MREGLSSSSKKVRLIAVAAVAKTKDPEAAALLRPLLADEAALVRIAVIDGLTALADVASSGAIAALATDPDPAVRKAVEKSNNVFELLIVRVDISEVQDLSGRNYANVTTRLQQRFERELGRLLKGGLVVERAGSAAKGHGALLKIRSITNSTSGGNGVLEVKCDMTLVEMPGKILRLTSSAAAAAGVDGAMPKSIEPELANDAIDACAPSLAKDFADYIEQRRKR